MAEPPAGWTMREKFLAAGLIVAAVCALLLGFRYVAAEKTVAAGAPSAPWSADLAAIWQPLLTSNRPLVVCIATPLSVLFPGVGFFRQFDQNDWEEASTSKAVAALKDVLHDQTIQPSFGYGEGTPYPETDGSLAVPQCVTRIRYR